MIDAAAHCASCAAVRSHWPRVPPLCICCLKDGLCNCCRSLPVCVVQEGLCSGTCSRHDLGTDCKWAVTAIALRQQAMPAQMASDDHKFHDLCGVAERGAFCTFAVGDSRFTVSMAAAAAVQASSFDLWKSAPARSSLKMPVSPGVTRYALRRG